jgi:hypothetical protein
MSVKTHGAIHKLRTQKKRAIGKRIRENSCASSKKKKKWNKNNCLAKTKCDFPHFIRKPCVRVCLCVSVCVCVCSPSVSRLCACFCASSPSHYPFPKSEGGALRLFLSFCSNRKSTTHHFRTELHAPRWVSLQSPIKSSAPISVCVCSKLLLQHRNCSLPSRQLRSSTMYRITPSNSM